MRTARAHAKINLALVVGPVAANGYHAVTTVLQRVQLADEVTVAPAQALAVTGFPDDTLVTGALTALASAAGVEPAFAARIVKRIPVAAGLGGGSSDAAAALGLANELLADPLPAEQLHEIAAGLGADPPFFLAPGPQLGEGDGRDLSPLDLPQDYVVVLVLPHGVVKRSTADVYGAFDECNGATGYEERRAALLDALAAGDLAALPPNDLASSPLAAELRDRGAFRADVTGAGPTVYGLFENDADAESAALALEARGRVWITRPVVA